MNTLPVDVDVDEELGPFMSNGFGDLYLHEVNRTAFNRVGSDTLIHERFSTLLEEDRMFVVVGTDSGLMPEYVMRRGVPEGSRYIFIEMPSVIARLEGKEGISQLDERIVICPLEEFLKRAEEFSMSTYVFIEKLDLLLSFGAEDAYLESYIHLTKAVRQLYSKVVWNYRQQLGYRPFLVRQLQNVAENRQPVARLLDQFPGETAILLAAGPSLTEVLPWVKENRDKLTVVAVSRCCHHLENHGIYPDIVVSIDPHEFNFDYGKGILPFWERALFIHANHVVPSLLSAWGGRNAYFASRFPWECSFEEKNLRGMGPTVSNTALSVLLTGGFSQILLAGVDLCFSRNNYAYAQGDDEPEDKREFSRTSQQVMTNGGWLADTIDDFSIAAEMIGVQIRAARGEERECRVINLCEGAAKIENVDYLPLDEIALERPSEAAQEKIQRLFGVGTADERVDHYVRCAEELDRVIGRMRGIRMLVIEALYCNDGLFGRNGLSPDFAYKKRMDAIEEELDTEYRQESAFLKRFEIAGFIKVVKPESNREWSDEDVEFWGRQYYETYRKAVDNVMEFLQGCRKRLETRIEEEVDEPNVARLISQWKDDAHSGRAVMWARRRPEVMATLDASQRAEFDAFSAAFQERLTNLHEGLKNQIDEYSSLRGLRGKVLEVYKQRDTSKLESIRDNLAERDEEEAGDLYHLVAGFVHELRGDSSAAIEELIQVKDERYREDALRQALGEYLNLGEYEKGIEVMENLAALSVTFFPHLAELHQILGNLEKAVEIYTDYLSLVPEDLRSMMKLGSLYKQIGVPDGVRTVAQHVLSIDPDNHAAQRMLADLEAT